MKVFHTGLLTLTLVGCGVGSEEDPMTSGPELEAVSAAQGAVTARSLRFGSAVRSPSGASFVSVCSSAGTTCTAVEVNPLRTGPSGYSLQTSCSYGSGCQKTPEYRGPTSQRCRYGEGCVAIPATLPRAEERCFYGSGCELFPVFGP
jgi:hypothetical protein